MPLSLIKYSSHRSSAVVLLRRRTCAIPCLDSAMGRPTMSKVAAHTQARAMPTHREKNHASNTYPAKKSGMGHASVRVSVIATPPLRLNLKALLRVASSASGSAASSLLPLPVSTSLILYLIMFQSNLVRDARLPTNAMAPPVTMPAIFPESIE